MRNGLFFFSLSLSLSFRRPGWNSEYVIKLSISFSFSPYSFIAEVECDDAALLFSCCAFLSVERYFSGFSPLLSREEPRAEEIFRRIGF